MTSKTLEDAIEAQTTRSLKPSLHPTHAAIKGHKKCAFELCPSPMYSKKWRVVTEGTRAGGRHWDAWVGQTLCDKCYSKFRKHGTLVRSIRTKNGWNSSRQADGTHLPAFTARRGLDGNTAPARALPRREAKMKTARGWRGNTVEQDGSDGCEVEAELQDAAAILHSMKRSYSIHSVVDRLSAELDDLSSSSSTPAAPPRCTEIDACSTRPIPTAWLTDHLSAELVAAPDGRGAFAKVVAPAAVTTQPIQVPPLHPMGVCGWIAVTIRT